MLTTTAFQETLGSKIISGEIDSFVVELSPADAVLLLELNTANRSPRNRISSQYAADMKAGRWQYAAEPLKFDTDGILLDGQHRLKALASLVEDYPDISVTFMIATGLSKKSQTVMDQGSKRTAGDNLGLQGIKSPNEVAAAARTYILWRNDRMFTDQYSALARVSNTEVQEWVMMHPDFVEDCTVSIKFKKSIDMSPKIYMAAYAAFRQIDHENAIDFMNMWDTGASLQVGHPVLALRDKLARIRRESTRTSDREYLALVIITWNAYRQGKTLQRYQRPNGNIWTKGTFPEPI